MSTDIEISAAPAFERRTYFLLADLELPQDPIIQQQKESTLKSKLISIMRAPISSTNSEAVRSSGLGNSLHKSLARRKSFAARKSEPQDVESKPKEKKHWWQNIFHFNHNKQPVVVVQAQQEQALTPSRIARNGFKGGEFFGNDTPVETPVRSRSEARSGGSRRLEQQLHQAAIEKFEQARFLSSASTEVMEHSDYDTIRTERANTEEEDLSMDPGFDFLMDKILCAFTPRKKSMDHEAERHSHLASIEHDAEAEEAYHHVPVHTLYADDLRAKSETERKTRTSRKLSSLLGPEADADIERARAHTDNRKSLRDMAFMPVNALKH